MEFQWEKCHRLCQNFTILLLQKISHLFSNNSINFNNQKTQQGKTLYFLQVNQVFRIVSYFTIKVWTQTQYKITSMLKEQKNLEKNSETIVNQFIKFYSMTLLKNIKSFFYILFNFDNEFHLER